MAIQDLLVGILRGLYKISNLRNGKFKIMNETTYQVHEVGKIYLEN